MNDPISNPSRSRRLVTAGVVLVVGGLVWAGVAATNETRQVRVVPLSVFGGVSTATSSPEPAEACCPAGTSGNAGPVDPSPRKATLVLAGSPAPEPAPVAAGPEPTVAAAEPPAAPEAPQGLSVDDPVGTETAPIDPVPEVVDDPATAAEAGMVPLETNDGYVGRYDPAWGTLGLRPDADLRVLSCGGPFGGPLGPGTIPASSLDSKPGQVDALIAEGTCEVLS